MIMTAHRTIEAVEPTEPEPVQPDPVQPEPVEPGTDAPGQPGPRPPPKLDSPDALNALVSRLTAGFATAGPEETPGPMDPYMRRALERTSTGTPFPSRSEFLAGVVFEFTERMTLVLEIADLIPRPGGDKGIVIVGGHVARFVDDLCIHTLQVRWPLPWSAPSWFPDGLSGADLIVMGTQFQQSAASAMDRELGRTFADAAHALLEAGAARLV
jgi:hypothetical protein